MKIRWAAFLVTLLACAPAFAKNEPVTLFFDLSYNGFKIAEVTETFTPLEDGGYSSKATPSPSVWRSCYTAMWCAKAADD